MKVGDRFHVETLWPPHPQKRVPVSATAIDNLHPTLCLPVYSQRQGNSSKERLARCTAPIAERALGEIESYMIA